MFKFIKDVRFRTLIDYYIFKPLFSRYERFSASAFSFIHIFMNNAELNRHH